MTEAQELPPRETMHYDAVIVGGGPESPVHSSQSEAAEVSGQMTRLRGEGKSCPASAQQSVL